MSTGPIYPVNGLDTSKLKDAVLVVVSRQLFPSYFALVISDNVVFLAGAVFPPSLCHVTSHSPHTPHHELTNVPDLIANNSLPYH